MKANRILVNSQYTLTRTSSGHLAMFITVLIKETNGSHEELSTTAVWQTQTYQINRSAACRTGWRGLQAQRDISDKSTGKSNLAKCEQTANKINLFSIWKFTCSICVNWVPAAGDEDILGNKCFPKMWMIKDENWRRSGPVLNHVALKSLLCWYLVSLHIILSLL